MELDEIDKKVLFELSQDARQSYKDIARQISSKKDTVAYHISDLQKKGIITKYVPVISIANLGLFGWKIYLQLHGLTKEAEKELMDSLLKKDSVVWVARSVGKWDLLLGFLYHDPLEFAQTKNKILSEFSRYIASYDITLLEDALVFGRDYLFEKSTPRKDFIYGGERIGYELDNTERKILSLIKNDARFEYTEIAKKLDLDSRTIRNKIKNLMQKGIIQGFTTLLDIKKLDMQLHKLCIYLNEHKKEKISKLVNYLKINPRTIHLIKSLGSWELEVEIESGDLFYIYGYISELKNAFPKEIRKIELVTITDEPKLDFFPS